MHNDTYCANMARDGCSRSSEAPANADPPAQGNPSEFLD